MKVRDIARELKISPKELMKFLHEMDMPIKSPATKVDTQTADQIKSLFEGESAEELLKEEKPLITLPDKAITIKEFAEITKAPMTAIMGAVLKKGLLLTINSEIDPDTARDIAVSLELNIATPVESATPVTHPTTLALEKIEEDILDQSDDAVERPPVIAIMGHVDHGKTKLLDTIRASNIIDTEAGNITQHIGAYQIDYKDRKLTFLDTPGHAAFTSLRARGAQVTDIAILVVAADESVKPQTLEALSHAKAANVPIIVAINKIDKPDANIDRVKQDLAAHDLLAEDWGGSVVMVGISALKGQGIDDLLDMVCLTADMLELKANPKALARGVVIESQLTKQRGAVATILIKNGTLRVGDNFVIGTIVGKSRALTNDLGVQVKSAPPSMPVELLGLPRVPSPGSILEVYPTEKECKDIAYDREVHQNAFQGQHVKQVSMETLSKQIEDGTVKSLNLVIKTDVHGSLEAMIQSIEQLPTEGVSINVIHSATGNVTENDVMLAKASGALIICFNVGVGADAAHASETEHIQIKSYSIIYEVLDDITKVIKGMFDPEYEEVEIGACEIRQIFKFSKVGLICGTYVTSGVLKRNAIARVFRDNTEIFKGKITSLKRFKDDVKEVKSGFECGLTIDAVTNAKEGDIIKCYELKLIE